MIPGAVYYVCLKRRLPHPAEYVTGNKARPMKLGIVADHQTLIFDLFILEFCNIVNYH